MRIFYCAFTSLFIALSTHGAAQASAPPAMPSDFDMSAPAPKILPSELDIPVNTHIDVLAWRKKPLPPIPPAQMNNPSLLWNPDLESAVIERGPQDVHAVLHWQIGRSSEAFVINGICFRLLCLATPDNVAMTGPALDLCVNRLDSTEGRKGNFPNTSPYSRSNFVGTASFNGSSVLVFAAGGKKAASDGFPEGPAVCLDPKTLLPVWICDGAFIYTYTYSPAPNVQINPQGAYLKAIIRQFGHYP